MSNALNIILAEGNQQPGGFDVTIEPSADKYINQLNNGEPVRITNQGEYDLLNNYEPGLISKEQSLDGDLTKGASISIPLSTTQSIIQDCFYSQVDETSYIRVYLIKSANGVVSKSNDLILSTYALKSTYNNIIQINSTDFICSVRKDENYFILKLIRIVDGELTLVDTYENDSLFFCYTRIELKKSESNKFSAFFAHADSTSKLCLLNFDNDSISLVQNYNTSTYLSNKNNSYANFEMFDDTLGILAYEVYISSNCRIYLRSFSVVGDTITFGAEYIDFQGYYSTGVPDTFIKVVNPINKIFLFLAASTGAPNALVFQVIEDGSLIKAANRNYWSLGASWPYIQRVAGLTELVKITDELFFFINQRYNGSSFSCVFLKINQDNLYIALSNNYVFNIDTTTSSFGGIRYNFYCFKKDDNTATVFFNYAYKYNSNPRINSLACCNFEFNEEDSTITKHFSYAIQNELSDYIYIAGFIKNESVIGIVYSSDDVKYAFMDISKIYDGFSSKLIGIFYDNKIYLRGMVKKNGLEGNCGKYISIEDSGDFTYSDDSSNCLVIGNDTILIKDFFE